MAHDRCVEIGNLHALFFFHSSLPLCGPTPTVALSPYPKSSPPPPAVVTTNLTADSLSFGSAVVDVWLARSSGGISLRLEKKECR